MTTSLKRRSAFRRRLVAIVLSLASVCALATRAPAAAQLHLDEAVSALHREGVEPALRALAAKDVAAARGRLTHVRRTFEALPPALRTAQATTVQRLARGYMAMRLYDESLALLGLAARALEAAAPMGDRPLALVLADMARAHRLGGRPGDAKALLDRAQGLRGPTAPTDPDAFPIQAELAELRRERGDLAGADNLLRPLVASADRPGGWEYVPNLVPVFEAYAALLTQRGDPDRARVFLTRAETIKKNMADAEDQTRRLPQLP